MLALSEGIIDKVLAIDQPVGSKLLDRVKELSLHLCKGGLLERVVTQQVAQHATMTLPVRLVLGTEVRSLYVADA